MFGMHMSRKGRADAISCGSDEPMGSDWCEENIDTIVGWLAEEAASRGLPFLNAVGRLLVKRAIHNARKATPH
jgi:hypothetical protein